MKYIGIKVKLRTLIIKDGKTGEEFKVKTLRTAQDIAEYIDESERDGIQIKLGRLVSEALDNS